MPSTDPKKIAQKVRYELDMFNIAYRLLNEPTTSDQFNHNLLLEGFLLHARVLRDFLRPDPPRDDDVLARHFFNNPAEWEQKESDLCPYLHDDKARINKKLAHLTYSRLTAAEGWDDATIHREINDAWDQFWSLLPRHKRKWFQRP